MPLRRFDMHCHLDFTADPAGIARQAHADGTGLLSVTTDPDAFLAAAGLLAGHGNVRVGVGLHPWWIDEGRVGEADIERFIGLVDGERFVGEVGLDFAGSRADSRNAQTRAFERMLDVCARSGGKVLSIHLRAAADPALDLIERFRCTDDNVCILHRFSGSNEQLWRAIRLGCRFSVDARMLATGRGREYLKLIPAGSLLVETDSPSHPDPDFTYDDLRTPLQAALDGIEALRGEMCERIARSSAELLGL